MSEFLGKISSYNLFNYFFCGVVFVILGDALTPYSFVQENVLTGVFLYYFIGLVLSRIGSLILEPVLKVFAFVRRAEYSQYVIASKDDPQLEVLSEVNNMYRTLVAVFVTLFFLKFYQVFLVQFVGGSKETYLLLTFLLVLFLFAYRKQTAYITKRINTDLHHHE